MIYGGSIWVSLGHSQAAEVLTCPKKRMKKEITKMGNPLIIEQQIQKLEDEEI